jgi:hypothetical protein
MAADKPYFQCKHCNKRYTKEEFLSHVSQYGLIYPDASWDGEERWGTLFGEMGDVVDYVDLFTPGSPE